ncbi:unnamed protein product [Blepharisma stoltei]|uniref:U-box domain-containing protein n=1 Tax=Blepharisma stoltei TaxID=1481888 RepID=A0AAU9JPQ3_9CILI|nr:unnamed protein product [Blepharisma stoltei]
MLFCIFAFGIICSIFLWIQHFIVFFIVCFIILIPIIGCLACGAALGFVYWIGKQMSQEALNEREKQLRAVQEAQPFIHEEFICPISKEVMRDPVITPYGHVFDRESIENWLLTKHQCPLTRKPLRKRDLKPYRQQFCNQNH